MKTSRRVASFVLLTICVCVLASGCSKTPKQAIEGVLKQVNQTSKLLPENGAEKMTKEQIAQTKKACAALKQISTKGCPKEFTEAFDEFRKSLLSVMETKIKMDEEGREINPSEAMEMMGTMFAMLGSVNTLKEVCEKYEVDEKLIKTTLDESN